MNNKFQVRGIDSRGLSYILAFYPSRELAESRISYLKNEPYWKNFGVVFHDCIVERIPEF